MMQREDDLLYMVSEITKMPLLRFVSDFITFEPNLKMPLLGSVRFLIQKIPNRKPKKTNPSEFYFYFYFYFGLFLFTPLESVREASTAM